MPNNKTGVLSANINIYGYGKLYYDTGELQVEGPFVNDKANGTCIKYNKNGESMSVEYKENLPIDLYNRIHNIGS